MISSVELNFLSFYIYDLVAKISLSPYEINIIMCAIAELKITDANENRDTLTLLYYAISKNLS